MTSIPSRHLGAVAFVAALATGLTAQTTVNITANLDNTLYEDPTGMTSNGVGVGVFVGLNQPGSIRRALVRFDVAGAIPVGAGIVSASLRMTVAQSSAGVPLAVDGHRVTQAWGEGTSVGSGGGGGGDVATNNDATWLHTFFPSSFWTNVGGDFVALPSFSGNMPTIGLFTVTANPVLVADVQSWLDAPATNFGWVLKAQTEITPGTARRLNSREALSNKPVLTVTYLLPGQVATHGIGCPSGAGTFDFAFGGSMVGGQIATLDHTNGPANGIGANIFALEVYHPGAELAPACNVYLPLLGGLIWGNLILFDASGFGTSQWPVPTAYPGLYFMSQTFALDPAAPLGFVLSNAGVAVIQ